MQCIPVTTEDEIRATADLAAEIWTEHFTPIIGTQQVQYMLQTVQSAQAMSDMIHRENYLYFQIQHDGRLSGYLAFRLKDENVFLSKLYLKKSCRGKGLARRALAFIEQFARKHQAQHIWLTVNKNNTTVISIYEKMGFSIDGPIVQDIGGGFIMDDYKMIKPIALPESS